MRALIIGATGFIGRELMKELRQNGHFPVATTRNVEKARSILGDRAEIVKWNGKSAAELANLLPGIDAVINLAGENLASGRWTVRRKKQITESRIQTGLILAEAIEISATKPSVLIQGSAVGIYGTPVDSAADENCPAGQGFIAELTQNWEVSVLPVEKYIPRIAWIRTGLVLGKNGGLLEKMLLPFRFYTGTILGSGNQWMSWIHIIDQVRAIRFLMENERSSGHYNLVAPSPATMKEFIKTTGKITGKPAWLRVPGWLLRSVLGEMAVETVLASQNIYPGRLLDEGFRFEFTRLEPALRNLLAE